MLEECYFFIDGDLPEDEQKVEVLCIGCRNEKYPEVGWYWSKEDGFGPWIYKCKVCKGLIYEPEETEETD